MLLLSCSVVSNSLRPHGLQHARLPCPLPSLRVFSNSCPLSQWCHPTKFLWRIPNLQYLRMWPCLEIGSLQRSSVRVMPLGWVLIQNDWRSYKKWQFGHRDMSRRKTMWREIQGECHVNMKTAIYKPKSGLEQILPLLPSEGTSPEDTWILAFWSLEQQNNKFLLFKPHSLWFLVMVALANQQTNLTRKFL